MTYLISLSVALLAGLLMTRVFKYLHLNFPDVTAYLLAGLLIGPYFLGKLNISGLGFSDFDLLNQLEILSSLALGFIAFSIGNEFRLAQLKETGKQATVIGIFQALVAALLVDAALLAVHFIFGEEVISIPAAITLGSIATATAPAATLMVVRQYKAKGKLTDLLLPIVALDDAVGLVVFAVSFGVAQAFKSGNLDIISVVVNPLVEIIGSLILGSIMGMLLTLLEKLFFSNSNRLSLTIAFVMATVALSGISFSIGPVTVSFSSLLVCMMLGTMFCNLCPRSIDIMGRADKWTVPLFALFFILSGAELELSVFQSISVVLIGIVYIVSRSLGKYFGARFSAKVTHCDKNIQEYLGITLLPQAGVALGMCVTASSLGGHDGVMIQNIVLFGVFIYELVGPMLTRWALEKAGDIAPMEAEKKTQDRFQSKPLLSYFQKKKK